MTSLATRADVEAILGTTITDAADQTRADRLIELASALVEDEVGRAFDTTAIVGELHNTPYRTSNILLKHWPIASVQEIREAGDALSAADFLVDLDAGIITRRASSSLAPWSSALSDIAIDYTPAIPEALVALTAGMVARAYRGGDNEAAAPAVMAGLRQLTIGRWSATREGSAETRAGTAIYLTGAELRVAHRWRDRRP